MNKYLIGGVLALIVVGLGFFWFCDGEIGSGSGKVERSFSKDVVGAGEMIEVELDIVLDGDQSYYLLEEIIPEGFVVLNGIGGNNRIRLVEIMNAKSEVFTYEVEAPSEKGEYVFSGEYGMKSVNGTRDIEGETVIRVE